MAVFCGACGQPVVAGAVFCAACGAAVATVGPADDASAAYPITVGAVGAPSTPVSEGESVGTQAAGADSDVRGRPLRGAVPAGVGIRLLALVIDGVVAGGLIALAVFLAPGIVAVVAVALLVVVGMVALLAIWGTSPGKAAVGVRVIGESSGKAPGWGPGLGRYVLRVLLLAVTIGIAGLSPLWDPARLDRAWWDRALGTRVIRARGAGADPAALNEAAGATGSDRPDSVRGAGWNDRPAAPRDPEDDMWWAGGVPRDDERSGGRTRVGGPAAEVASSSAESAVPWGTAPAASGLISAVPGGSFEGPVRPERPPPEHRQWGNGALDDEVERTRHSSRSREPLRLELDDGRSFPVQGSILVGRDPAAVDGSELLIAVPDETLSVSKTHLRIDRQDGEVLVTDLHSTNGVAVVSAGAAHSCVPGIPTSVAPSATIRFGDRELRLGPPVGAATNPQSTR